MRNRTTVVGGALGALGALLLAVFLLKPDAGQVSGGAPAAAFVVAESLTPGMSVDEVKARVRGERLPEGLLPQRRVRRWEDVAGQKVLRPVGPGEVLTLDQFAPPGPVAGGVVVPAGYEALTIEAEPAPGVGGYVTPGARVNVYVTVTVSEQSGQPLGSVGPAFTQLVAGHLDVLAVTRGTLTGEAQPVDPAAAQGKITLLLQVPPADVPVLIHAQSRGALWFTLVNRDDPAPRSVRVVPDALSPAARSAAIAEARRRQDAAAAARPATTGAASTPGGGA